MLNLMLWPPISQIHIMEGKEGLWVIQDTAMNAEVFTAPFGNLTPIVRFVVTSFSKSVRIVCLSIKVGGSLVYNYCSTEIFFFRKFVG